MEFVFCTYRTASTYYCKQLANKLKGTNLDEWFHQYKPNTWQEKYRRLCRMPQSTVVKVITTQIPGFCDNGDMSGKELNALLDISNKDIHILARKDFVAQVESFVVALTAPHDWHTEWQGVEEIDTSKMEQDGVNAVRFFELNTVYLARLYFYLKRLNRFNVLLNYKEDFANDKPYENRLYKLSNQLEIPDLDIQLYFEDENYTNKRYRELIKL